MIKTPQRGFTLIELVVVIVILGILAAFAVPRFMGLEAEARVATVKSMGGTLRSTAAMAHSLCMAQGCGLAGSVTVDGRQITMVQGYPNRATLPSAIQSMEGFTATNQGNGSVRFTKVGAGGNCWVQYNQAAANNSPTIQYRAGVAGLPGGVTDVAIDAMLRTDCR